MRRLAAVTMLALAVLAGCSKPGKIDEKNATPEQVGKAIADASADIHLAPGRWETTADLKSIEGPGIPPAALSIARQSLANKGAVATCLTPEEAARPGASFFNKDAGNCTYHHFKMENGEIDALLTCGAKGTETAAFKGRYEPRHYAIDMTTKSNIGGRSMTIAMSLDSKNTGQCRGDEQGKGGE